MATRPGHVMGSASGAPQEGPSKDSARVSGVVSPQPAARSAAVASAASSGRRAGSMAPGLDGVVVLGGQGDGRDRRGGEDDAADGAEAPPGAVPGRAAARRVRRIGEIGAWSAPALVTG